MLADAEKYGDERRSPINVRAPAEALDETSILPTEAMTVVLSERGWIRAAKGHEIDPSTLSYKAGDQFQSAALGRSNQTAVFLDSTGRTYSLAAHTLPSARGLGEPLSGRTNPPDGATFKGVMLGEADDLVFGRRESKKQGGAVGLLTEDKIDRARLYEPSVLAVYLLDLARALHSGYRALRVKDEAADKAKDKHSD